MTTSTTSVHYHLRLRGDLSREEARAYWSGPHADIVRRLPHVAEYRQHHFSVTDHGYWPATRGVAVDIPEHERLDGFAELTFSSLAAAPLVALGSRQVMADERNFLSWDAGHLACLGGGQKWDDRCQLGHHTALLLRRRPGVRRAAFRRFVHETLAPALKAAGAQGLRSYTFLSSLPHPTPGVAHTYPTQHRFHGAVLFGSAHRTEVEALLAHPALAPVLAEQHQACSAAHAYGTDRVVPAITKEAS